MSLKAAKFSFAVFGLEARARNPLARANFLCNLALERLCESDTNLSRCHLIWHYTTRCTPRLPSRTLISKLKALNLPRFSKVVKSTITCKDGLPLLVGRTQVWLKRLVAPVKSFDGLTTGSRWEIGSRYWQIWLDNIPVKDALGLAKTVLILLASYLVGKPRH